MDRDEMIFEAYKSYCEQKENFINRNFKTNKFYIHHRICCMCNIIISSNKYHNEFVKTIIRT